MVSNNMSFTTVKYRCTYIESPFRDANLGSSVYIYNQLSISQILSVIGVRQSQKMRYFVIPHLKCIVCSERKRLQLMDIIPDEKMIFSVRNPPAIDVTEHWHNDVNALT